MSFQTQQNIRKQPNPPTETTRQHPTRTWHRLPLLTSLYPLLQTWAWLQRLKTGRRVYSLGAQTSINLVSFESPSGLDARNVQIDLPVVKNPDKGHSITSLRTYPVLLPLHVLSYSLSKTKKPKLACTIQPKYVQIDDAMIYCYTKF
jgi:hypothetical protein